MSRFTPVLRSVAQWMPGYVRTRAAQLRSERPRRIWVAFTDHFEPWWHSPSEATALERVERWTSWWPTIADRHRDSAGRPACFTFFYPEEQYHPAVMDALAGLRDSGTGDVDIHIHHDNDTAAAFVDRMGVFLERLRGRHGLLRADEHGTRFGFIHGNWALDNSLPGGRYCGLNNEITLLKDLGCYADFTLPSAPSPAQTPVVNTIYWATDDPSRPRSHESGVPVAPGGRVAGDLMLIPGPLTFNVREWSAPNVPKLDSGELAGNCLPTRHRARLWIRVAPRLGADVFVKLFGHGAPEKNAIPLLEGGGMDRTLDYLTDEARSLGADIYFVSAWNMWRAVEAIRQGVDPLGAVRTEVLQQSSELSRA